MRKCAGERGARLMCYNRYDMTKQNYFIIAAVVLAFLIVGAWYALRLRERAQAPEPQAFEEEPPAAAPAEILGAELLEKAQHPLKGELPQTNPFTEAETNPFVDVYKNPFTSQ